MLMFYSDDDMASTSALVASIPAELDDTNDLCAVCLGDEEGELVICDKCSRWTHVFCYGLTDEDLEVAEWNCDECLHGVTLSTRPSKCVVCPLQDRNVMRIPSKDKNASKKAWAQVSALHGILVSHTLIVKRAALLD